MGKPAAKGPDNNKRLALLETIIASAPATVIAMVCHEANRAYCASLGDDSQLEWMDAPEWQRESAVNGVQFHLANPEAGDSASHDNWMREKLEAGWVFGEVKDPEATPPTHPCLVPFDELPPAQQFKDRLFRTLVHSVAAALAGVSAAHAADAAGNDDPDDRVAGLEEQVRTLTEQLGEAQAEIAKFDAGKARQHRPGKVQVKARKAGPVKADEGELATAMESGEELELVFSNGDREITDFEPVLVRGAAFDKRGGGRFALRDKLTVRGAGTEHRIRGVALLRDGKPVAFCQFPKPVAVPVGGERAFDRMIVFG